MTETLYFNDNFFSSGETNIYNDQKGIIGLLDLKSAFSDGVNIIGTNGQLQLRGYFPFFSNKWNIEDGSGSNIGILRTRFAFFKKLYEYNAQNGENFQIESEAFSRAYTISDSSGSIVCEFKRVDGFFESAAFQLTNFSDRVLSTEWVAVVMGVNAIQDRNNNTAASVNH